MVVVADPGTIFVKQARPFSPSMFMAQEPQIPSRQDLLKASVVSCSFLILNRASRTIVPQLRSLGTEVEKYSLRSITYFS